jgi:hypothetical protein
MFKAIRNQFMWNDDFDREWRLVGERFVDNKDVPIRWERRLREKKAYWRENGKRQKMSVSHAIFQALIEIADELYREEAQNPRLGGVWPRLADRLYFAATTLGHVPGIPVPINRLPDRWRDFYEQYRTTKGSD